MRTTIAIDDGLLETAKAHARERHLTLGQLIEAGLRRELACSEAEPEIGPPLPVFHGSGLLPGIDSTSNASMAAAVSDKNEEFARLRRNKSA